VAGFRPHIISAGKGQFVVNRAYPDRVNYGFAAAAPARIGTMMRMGGEEEEVAGGPWRSGGPGRL
jgi:hypothetical protein